MKKNGINLNFAKSISPEPNDIYRYMDDTQRFNMIESTLNKINQNWSEKFNLVSARENGFVVLEFKNSIPVSERSDYLLEIEKKLCQFVDPAITLWIAPVGDKSSLRKLRGIEVKNI
jgi:hypothetical protein